MKRGRKKQDVDPAVAFQQIIDATLKKNYDEVEDLLSKGAKIDYVMKSTNEAGAATQRTAFHQIVMSGDLDALEWIASKGVMASFPMEKGWTVLHYCVREDKMLVLQKLCDMASSGGLRLDVDRKDDDGNSPVQTAINIHRADMAKVLLKAGAVHAFENRSYTGPNGPLTQMEYACATGDVETLETLHELGVSLHTRDTHGNGLMHLAVVNKHWAVVDALLDKGLSVNGTNCRGETPLLHGVIHQRGSDDPQSALEILSTLAAKGADVNCVDGMGLYLLHHAIHSQNLALVQSLLDLGATLSKSDRNGNTALHWAAQGASPEVLQKILGADDKKNGELDINALNREKNTPLHKACTWGRTGCVRLLMAANGINQNLVNLRGRSPLHEAARNGTVECIQLLIDKNALGQVEEVVETKKKPPAKGKGAQPVQEEMRKTDIEIVDNNGETALQIAMVHGHTSVVQVLISNNASVRRYSPKYGTLIHQAVAVGNLEIAESLITGGADVQSRDTKDLTALHLAVGTQSVAMAKLLLQHGAKVNAKEEHGGRTPLHMAAEGDMEEIVVLLVDHSAAVGTRDNNCKTPLHLAAEKGSSRVAAVLCANGAEVQAPDLEGKTPLHLACQHGHADVARILVEHSAGLEVTDHRGWSPLHLAVFTGSVECVALLLEQGVEMNETEVKDRTPFLLAAEAGKVETARQLIRRWQQLKEVEVA